MKKRILALALAGTTAFSVFGAAMSANAVTLTYWRGDSTHVSSDDGDYYVEYKPAGLIHWTAEEVQVTLENPNQAVYTTTSYEAVDHEDGAYIPSGTTLYVLDPGNFNGDDKFYNVEPLTEMSGYYATLTDYMESRGYKHKDIEGAAASDVEIGDETVDVDQAPYLTIDGVTYYVYSRNFGGEHNNEGLRYYIFTAEQILAGEADNYQKAALTYVDNNADRTSDIYYTENSNGVVASEVYVRDDRVANWTDDEGNQRLTAYFEQFIGYSRSKLYYIADIAGTYNIGTNYVVTPTDNAEKVVINYIGAVDTVWTDMRYTALEAGVSSFEEVMETEVQNGVVYLYDYYNSTSYPSWLSADDFEEAWGDGTLATVLGGSGEIWPEDGYSYRYIRGDVLDAWEDFLDDLGISDPNMTNDELTIWAEDTYSNYLYTYRDTNAITNVEYNPTTGTWVITVESGRNVDVYNFADLIEDILDLAPAMNPDMNDTQTSELVYLMQQYEKYTDGFVDVIEPDTDDWGDLLVALAEAPTADEFSTSNNYKRYTNRVEDLVEEYEEADTNAAVKIAEQNLYDFVTDIAADYKVSEKADKTVLTTSLDNLFFNYEWRNSYNNGEAGDDNIAGPAEVYLGALETDGTAVRNRLDTNYTYGYALYPMADYAGTVMTGSYPGVDTPVYGVTSEYFWFYNVYDLAFNVYSGNTHQSTIDLMATTLDEAVAALVPDANSSARASDVLGAEEASDKLVDLIETDYDSVMWGNKTKITNYILDRVLNDEIGEVGTNNSEDIANRTAYLMGWQKYQTSVTRSEINSLKTYRANAQTALTALRNDEDNYNAAQANALEKAIEDCDYIIAIYDGDYATFGSSQTVNADYNGAVGDKDQILKSDITDAMDAVDAAINFSNIIQGWSQDEDGNWKYGTEEGYLNDGWHQVDGGKTWFYFEENETAKQSEWWQDPETGTWYWFNSNCGAAVGWAKIDGDWYYFKGNNAMKTGWEKVEGSWYYMNSSGKMVTGWCQINGTWYYFSKESNALGQMLANTTTPDGYKVDANGALVE